MCIKTKIEFHGCGCLWEVEDRCGLSVVEILVNIHECRDYQRRHLAHRWQCHHCEPAGEPRPRLLEILTKRIWYKKLYDKWILEPKGRRDTAKKTPKMRREKASGIALNIKVAFSLLFLASEGVYLAVCDLNSV